MKRKSKMTLLCAMALILSLILSLGGCGSAGTAADGQGKEEGPIIIGHNASLTGTGARFGLAEVNALDMYVKQVNEGGGILGRQLKVIHYDNKGDQAEAVNICTRLIGEGIIAMIGPSQSGNAIACAAICEEKKVPLITTTGTNELLTVPKGQDKALEYAFRVCFIDPYQGSVAATFAYEDLGGRKAAILTDVGSDYSTYLGKYFTGTFEALGGSIVAHESFRSEELEYKAQLAKIKESGADILYLPSTHTQGALAMKQARELGMTCEFIGCDNWPTQELMEIAGSAAQGAYLVNSASMEDPLLADFVKQYRETYKEDPVMPNPAFALDAIMVLKAAIEDLGNTNTEEVANWMANAKDVRVLTGVFTNDPATHNPIGKNAVIEQVSGDGFAYVKTVSAAQ